MVGDTVGDLVGALVGDTVGDLVGLRHGRRLKWCLSIIGDTVYDLVRHWKNRGNQTRTYQIGNRFGYLR